jgi:hypothetical protein
MPRIGVHTPPTTEFGDIPTTIHSIVNSPLNPCIAGAVGDFVSVDTVGDTDFFVPAITGFWQAALENPNVERLKKS